MYRNGTKMWNISVNVTFLSFVCMKILPPIFGSGVAYSWIFIKIFCIFPQMEEKIHSYLVLLYVWKSPSLPSLAVVWAIGVYWGVIFIQMLLNFHTNIYFFCIANIFSLFVWKSSSLPSLAVVGAIGVYWGVIFIQMLLNFHTNIYFFCIANIFSLFVWKSSSLPSLAVVGAIGVYWGVMVTSGPETKVMPLARI